MSDFTLFKVVVVDTTDSTEYTVQDVYSWRVYSVEKDLFIEFMVKDERDRFATSTWSLGQHMFHLV